MEVCVSFYDMHLCVGCRLVGLGHLLLWKPPETFVSAYHQERNHCGKCLHPAVCCHTIRCRGTVVQSRSSLLPRLRFKVVPASLSWSHIGWMRCMHLSPFHAPTQLPLVHSNASLGNVFVTSCVYAVNCTSSIIFTSLLKTIELKTHCTALFALYLTVSCQLFLPNVSN